MKTKTILILFLFLLHIGFVSARSLVIELKDGTKMYYLISLDENPCLVFDQGDMSIKSDLFTVSEVEKFYISETDNPNRLTNPQQEDTFRSTGLAAESLHIIIENLNPEKLPLVSLFSIEGKALESSCIFKDKELIVETSGLARGIYILKIGNKSLKFQKK
ncbi:MAG: hypothetical protein PHF61_03520 [Bacteroidales bacterium]|nr:hypothetical protein [Bacteroidales bacterium]